MPEHAHRVARASNPPSCWTRSASWPAATRCAPRAPPVACSPTSPGRQRCAPLGRRTRRVQAPHQSRTRADDPRRHGSEQRRDRRTPLALTLTIKTHVNRVMMKLGARDRRRARRSRLRRRIGPGRPPALSRPRRRRAGQPLRSRADAVRGDRGPSDHEHHVGGRSPQGTWGVGAHAIGTGPDRKTLGQEVRPHRPVGRGFTR